MPKNIYCQKLKRNAEQLDAAPMPGELGQKIHQLISKPAWESWLTQQTMLINENHLTLTNPEAKAFLREN
ncbi:MAG: oxidative damage protection protein, partial [Francisellaceae bacterium]|nr:oxidative damage protection protein [Francisellaceae bacterium]